MEDIYRNAFFILICVTFISCYSRTTICQYNEGTLSCDKDEVISIEYALFGRFNNNSKCKTLSHETCSSPSDIVTQRVRSKCEGQKSCQLEASILVYGNPCGFMVIKYLEVGYRCEFLQSTAPNVIKVTTVSTILVSTTYTDSPSNTVIVIALVVGSLSVVVIMVIVAAMLWKRKYIKGIICKEKKETDGPPSDNRTEGSIPQEYLTVVPEDHSNNEYGYDTIRPQQMPMQVNSKNMYQELTPGAASHNYESLNVNENIYSAVQ